MVMGDPTAPFDIEKTMLYPEWDAKAPAVPLRVQQYNHDGTPRPTFFGTVGDIVDYDGDRSSCMDQNREYNFVRFPKTFYAQLEIYSFAGGRSAANIVFRDVCRGYKYYMPATEALVVIDKAMRKGSRYVTGEFKMTKRGSNYRLRAVE